MITTVRVPYAVARAVDERCELDRLHDEGSEIDRRIALEALALSDGDRYRLIHLMHDPREVAR